jgi:multidrug efflux pump subunit AcrA (membrane-fusion protein)
MKKRPAIVLAGVLIAGVGVAAFVTLSIRTQAATAVIDPRQEPPVVRLVTAARVTGSERGLTGVVAARVQSNLGFRVAGKIVERLVNVGEAVKAGQPLMRIDETDLRLALTAKRNAVTAARASVVQLDADEQRYADLVSKGWASRQRYEQAKAASDTAKAQLAAAEAGAGLTENEAARNHSGGRSLAAARPRRMSAGAEIISRSKIPVRHAQHPGPAFGLAAVCTENSVLMD